ncbi:hypothetical protein Y032_0001g331 [Ancylostoma ceylanicum]|uniref:Uncharacterized protein n=1 Tax=Ancylostoma ceylanicum TaxID=53326 RepID=A0A016W4N2_9BILA|nr:hypothetical protein Y032_0001g331 [Ancylostoma ceylanicum]
MRAREDAVARVCEGSAVPTRLCARKAVHGSEADAALQQLDHLLSVLRDRDKGTAALNSHTCLFMQKFHEKPRCSSPLALSSSILFSVGDCVMTAAQLDVLKCESSHHVVSGNREQSCGITVVEFITRMNTDFLKSRNPIDSCREFQNKDLA